MTMTNTPRPLALIILDGWGHREEADGNAIKAAHTPVWDALWENSPHTLLSASGLDAGLPAEQMGNSEVGHSIMGAGRVIYQNFTRINKDIADGGFYANPALCAAVDTAVQSGKKLHLLGLLSPGGVHSHAAHFHAMAELAAQRGAQSVFVHAFVDGRDTPPRSAKDTLHQMDEKLTTLGNGRIASVTGRYFAMDRDERWERVQQAYRWPKRTTRPSAPWLLWKTPMRVARTTNLCRQRQFVVATKSRCGLKMAMSLSG